MSLDEWFQGWRERIEIGAREYGDLSFDRPVTVTAGEILEEQVDQVGWLFVMWCQAARLEEMPRDQEWLVAAFEGRVRNRIASRRDLVMVTPAPEDRLGRIEELAADLVQASAVLRVRVEAIARRIAEKQAGLEPQETNGC